MCRGRNTENSPWNVKETGFYGGEEDNGNLILNFTRIDQIYDGFIARGIRPFVELSFVPPAMADDIEVAVHPFKYHPIVSSPKDPVKWYQLIERFIKHLAERYPNFANRHSRNERKQVNLVILGPETPNFR